MAPANVRVVVPVLPTVTAAAPVPLASVPVPIPVSVIAPVSALSELIVSPPSSFVAPTAPLMVVAAVPESIVRVSVPATSASTAPLKLTIPSTPPVSVVIAILLISSTGPVNVRLGALPPVPAASEVLISPSNSILVLPLIDMVLISSPAPIACTDTVPVPAVPVVSVRSSSLVPAIAPAILMFPPLDAALLIFVLIVRSAPSASNIDPPTNDTAFPPVVITGAAPVKSIFPAPDAVVTVRSPEDLK